MADPRDDQQLLAAHVGGDPGAFAVLVARHQNYLYAVAVGIMRDRDNGADALQDAMINAFRRAATYEGRGATVQTWLRQVTRNACLDQLRRAKARPSTVLAVDDQVEMASSQRVDDSTAAAVDIAAALRTLPDDQRETIVLVDCYGWSVADAAARLGVAQGTVKSRCARARTALRHQLGAGWGSPTPTPVREGRK